MGEAGRAGKGLAMFPRWIRKAAFGLTAAALVLTLGVSLAGCGGKRVAEVNGEVIREADLERELRRTRSHYESQGIDFAGDEGARLQSDLRELVLEQMITETILLQEARRRGIEVTAEQVDRRMEEEKSLVGGEAAYRQALQEQLLMSEAEYRKELEEQLTLEALYQQVVAGQEVGPQEIADYYEQNKEQFVIPERIRASHILLNTEEEARQVLALLRGGAQFDQLAVERSVDHTARENRGDLGYFDRDASLVAEFKEAAFSLKTGEVTPSPVKTMFGYHLIKVVDRIPARQQSLEEVRETIVDRLRQNKEMSFFQQFVEELREGAKIVREGTEGEADG